MLAIGRKHWPKYNSTERHVYVRFLLFTTRPQRSLRRSTNLPVGHPSSHYQLLFTPLQICSLLEMTHDMPRPATRTVILRLGPSFDTHASSRTAIDIPGYTNEQWRDSNAGTEIPSPGIVRSILNTDTGRFLDRAGPALTSSCPEGRLHCLPVVLLSTMTEQQSKSPYPKHLHKPSTDPSDSITIGVPITLSDDYT